MLHTSYKKMETVARDRLEPAPSYQKSEEFHSAKNTSEALVLTAPKRREVVDKATRAFNATSKKTSFSVERYLTRVVLSRVTAITGER